MLYICFKCFPIIRDIAFEVEFLLGQNAIGWQRGSLIAEIRSSQVSPFSLLGCESLLRLPPCGFDFYSNRNRTSCSLYLHSSARLLDGLFKLSDQYLYLSNNEPAHGLVRIYSPSVITSHYTAGKRRSNSGVGF